MRRLRPTELVDELAAATGLDVERGTSPHVKLPGGIRTIQRLALEFDNAGDLVLLTWPAELKAQAKAFYGQRPRADAVIEMCRSSRWDGTPNGHLAYWLAPPARRWYFVGGRLGLEEYVSSWIENLDRVHGYRRDEVETKLWPWLTRCGYAGGDLDRRRMEDFLSHARPEVHLRPGIQLAYRWTAAEAQDLHTNRTLRQALRHEADRVLTALGESQLG